MRRFADSSIRKRARYRRIDGEQALCADVARLLAEEKVVGWVHGRMEFGPRALGNRSILGDARSPAMQKVMNLKVKFRESFRPFAPAVLKDRACDYFDLGKGQESPYMLLVAPVAESQRLPLCDREAAGLEKLSIIRSTIPAVTHVDFSARVETVDPERHGRFYRLLRAVRGQDRLPGARQHELQHPRRADRLHSRGRLPLLHGDQYRRPRPREPHVLLKSEQPDGGTTRWTSTWQRGAELD